MAMVSYSPAVYEGKTIPGWAEFIGWMMVLGPVFCVVGRAAKVLLYRKIPVLWLSNFNLHLCDGSQKRVYCKNSFGVYFYIQKPFSHSIVRIFCH